MWDRKSEEGLIELLKEAIMKVTEALILAETNATSTISTIRGNNTKCINFYRLDEWEAAIVDKVGLRLVRGSSNEATLSQILSGMKTTKTRPPFE